MTTITKSTCETYKLRGLPHNGWADITIDAADQHGRIQIASDWGNWQYFWSHCGEPFKEFLPGLNLGYVAGKFGCDGWFDAEATVKQFKVDVLERRRWTSIDKDEARQVWNEIGYLECITRRTEFCVTLERDCPALMKFHDYAPPLYDGIEPMFRNFWRDCWPVLIETIKAETKQQVNSLS